MEALIAWIIIVVIAKWIYDAMHPINSQDPNKTLLQKPSSNGSVNFKQVFLTTFILTALISTLSITGMLGVGGIIIITTFPAMVASGLMWAIIIVKERFSAK